MNASVDNPGDERQSDNVTILVLKEVPCGTFRFSPNDDAQEVILYKQCFGIITAAQGNTTPIYIHLKNHHKIQYELSMKDKGATPKNTSRLNAQTSLTQMLHGASPYPVISLRHQEITNAITHHLAKDMAPVNTVEKGGLWQ